MIDRIRDKEAQKQRCYRCRFATKPVTATASMTATIQRDTVKCDIANTSAQQTSISILSITFITKALTCRQETARANIPNAFATATATGKRNKAAATKSGNSNMRRKRAWRLRQCADIVDYSSCCHHWCCCCCCGCSCCCYHYWSWLSICFCWCCFRYIFAATAVTVGVFWWIMHMPTIEICCCCCCCCYFSCRWCCASAEANELLIVLLSLTHSHTFCPLLVCSVACMLARLLTCLLLCWIAGTSSL